MNFFAPQSKLHPALFPPARDRAIWDQQLAALLAEAERAVPNGPVMPSMDAAVFAQELASFDFAAPLPMDALLDWTVAKLRTGLVQLTHPRYLGLFNPAPSYAATCADRIAASFNPQLASAATSPAAIAIEAHVIRAVCARTGLSAGATGHFTSGGSEANFTSLICALTRAEPDFARRGARAFAGPPVFYISADSHLAWIKIAHQAGIGRDAARLVATDNHGRMCADELRAAIAADRAAGAVPVMIAATAGTTNAGMVDPLSASAAICRAENLWYHVDAAWGGALIASETYKPLLAGIELADSVTIDAHKWFATTMGCGMFLTAHPAMLTEAFSVAASFMPAPAPSLDPYTNTAQWSRRFTGLRLFMSLAAVGWDGHAAHVEHSFSLTRRLGETMESHGWRYLNPESLAVACLLPPAGAPPAREIVAKTLATGAAWVSAANFAGSQVIRACVTNGQTTEADIAVVAAGLQEAAQG
jgi:aromatic-L-amino-acid decarboxylase